MDFMVDRLVDGRGFRTLNIVDDFTRECVALEVDRSLPGLRVVRVLDRLALKGGTLAVRFSSRSLRSSRYPLSQSSGARMIIQALMHAAFVTVSIAAGQFESAEHVSDELAPRIKTAWR